MTYTKQAGLGFNWVVRLGGQTVQEAIATLQALPQDAVLPQTLFGYYDVEADVMQTVPMTNDEILQLLESKWEKHIANHQRLYDIAVKTGNVHHQEVHQFELLNAKHRIETVRLQYGK